MAHELEVIGPASSWLSERVQTFCESLAGTAWGDVPAARLVIAQDLAVALRRYLPADRYQAWERRQRDRGNQATGVGMGFVASDGVPTAVVVALPESTNRADLLSLCCHELGELSIEATGGEDRETDRRGDERPDLVRARRRAATAEVFTSAMAAERHGPKLSQSVVEGLPGRLSRPHPVGGSERRRARPDVRPLADHHPRGCLRLWPRPRRQPG